MTSYILKSPDKPVLPLLAGCHVVIIVNFYRIPVEVVLPPCLSEAIDTFDVCWSITQTP